MEGNKILYRSRRNRVIAGVCAGLAEYFNIDIALMRVLFVVAAIGGVSFGFWMYVILWIVVPEENIIGPGAYDKTDDDTIDITPNEEKPKKTTNGALIASLILIFIGLVALVDNFMAIAWIWKLWPIILILIGVVILINSQKNNENGQ